MVRECQDSEQPVRDRDYQHLYVPHYHHTSYCRSILGELTFEQMASVMFHFAYEAYLSSALIQSLPGSRHVGSRVFISRIVVAHLDIYLRPSALDHQVTEYLSVTKSSLQSPTSCLI
jgi:hypothetical protein